MGREDNPLSVGRNVKLVGSPVRRERHRIFFCVGGQAKRKRFRFCGIHAQLVEAEIAFVHNHLPVVRNRGVVDSLPFVEGHLDGVVLTRLDHLRRKLPEVHGSVSVGGEEDFAGGGPEGPGVVPFERRQLTERLLLEVHDPNVRVPASPIVLPPGSKAPAVERKPLAVGREGSETAHAGSEGLGHFRFEGNGEQFPSPFGAVRSAVNDSAAIRRPAGGEVVIRESRQLLRGAPFRRDDIDIVVAGSLARERDVPPVGREKGIQVPFDVDGQAAELGAVLSNNPQVAEITEDDVAVVIVRMPQDAGFFLTARGRGRQKTDQAQPNQ